VTAVAIWRDHRYVEAPTGPEKERQEALMRQMYAASLNGEVARYRELGLRLSMLPGSHITFLKLSFTLLRALERLQREEVARTITNPWDDRMVLVRAERLPPLMTDACAFMHELREVWLTGDDATVSTFMADALCDVTLGGRMLGELGAWLHLANSGQLGSFIRDEPPVGES
jgi:hypothetical protein